MSNDVHVIGMNGLGDSIYARPFIRKLCEHSATVYLTTPWPELYSDIPVAFIKPKTRLRTQVKNMGRSDVVWWDWAPPGTRVIRVGYSSADMARGSIIDALARTFGVRPGPFDLPNFGPSPVVSDRPIAVIRPPTVRREWLNPSRNPASEYIDQAAGMLRDAGYHVVSVADVVPGLEWIVGKDPFAHQRFHKGELNVTQLLALVQNAAVVVGGVGWIVPAALATGTQTFIVYGGNGGNNGPSKILPDQLPVNVSWAAPSPFCGCTSSSHHCNKEIHGFERKFTQWLTRSDVRSHGTSRDVLVA